MIKIRKQALWTPDYHAATVLDIDTQTLRHAGITHLVFDLDDTLVLRRQNELSVAYAQFIRTLQQQGFTVLLGSNTKRDIHALTAALGVTAVQPSGLSYKPLPSFYKRIIRIAGTAPQHIVMIGNHRLNDIVGANWSGLTTILVKSLRVKNAVS